MQSRRPLFGQGAVSPGLLGVAAMLILLLAPAALAQAAAPEVRAPVIVEQVGTFNGKQVRYRSVVAETVVPDPDGRPGARIVSTAYLAQDAGNPAERPVMFIWNGGPISASVYLHMGAFGPKRIAFPDDLDADTTQLPVVDNPHTILDVADLVFVDPAGTGFSRVMPGVDPHIYRSVVGDGQQVAAFIRRWLRDNGRLESPQYLFGESYGTMRAAQVARTLLEGPDPVELEGMVLFGQALNIIEFSQRPGNIVSFAVSMPTLSALAWHHGKVDRAGRTLEQLLDESRAFARDEYLRALYIGDQLEPVERQRIAEGLEALTGLSANYYLAHNLRITKEAYRRELLKDQGLILGRNDGRYAGPPSEAPGGGDPSNVIADAVQRGFKEHLRDNLRVDWQDEYRFAEFPEGGLEGWDWGATSPFSDWPYMQLVSEVMERVPHFRVLVGVGIYDTSTTTGASEYALAQSGWPRERAGIAYYGGGHMAYSDEASLQKLMRDMRIFMRPGQ
ncbi:S10 family peptidase [Sphingosinicella sp. CPCC 101087]|uniref:S10 family peptidase n=1 Tax=Sphingosinicella sp. CPCC 101087 TaxID=2497754 RepID=UPI001FB0AABB|nr:peptidase S10 [Sphingosinicella sp. CPCC 101087]